MNNQIEGKATASLKICCIINNRAGPTGEPFGTMVAALFVKHGAQTEIVEVSKNHPPQAIAEDAIRRKCDVIVAAGGDGTINGVATAVVGNAAVKFGVIPRGTLNHFAQALGVPTDIEQAVETILAGYVRVVDVGQVNDRIFVNNASVGLYASIVRMRENLQHAGFSKWPAAILASLRIFARFRRLALELVPATGAGIQQNTSMLFIGNNAYDLQFPALGARPTLDSGQLWVMMPKSATRVGLIASFLNMIAGRESAADALAMEATKLTVNCKQRFLKVAVDGEVVQLSSPLKFIIRPKALRVIVPAPSTNGSQSP